MRIGISLTSRYVGLDGRAAVGTVIGRARAAAEAGLDHLSLGDHHAVGSDGPYVQNVPMLGRLMAEWPTDRPAGLLLLLPLWHPVLAAEQIGTLASMSDAPFIVQTGIGGGAAQFAAFGADLSTRGRVSDLMIDAIRRLLAGDAVDIPEFGVRGASISPIPPQPVQWWVGAGPAPAAIERAAREGDAWYVSPGLDGEALAAAVEAYREACDRHDREPAIALRRDVLVGDDHDATVRAARRVIERGYRGLDEQVVCGDTAHVAERFASYRDLGVVDVVARTIAVDEPAALRSIELLGEVRTELW